MGASNNYRVVFSQPFWHLEVRAIEAHPKLQMHLPAEGGRLAEGVGDRVAESGGWTMAVAACHGPNR